MKIVEPEELRCANRATMPMRVNVAARAWVCVVFIITLAAVVSSATASEDGFHRRVDADIWKKPLKEALSDLETQFSIRLQVEPKLLDGWEPVEAHFKNTELGRILTRLLKPRGLGLEILGPTEARINRLNDMEEFKPQGEQVFEFSEKPTVRRTGDRVSISFATKAFCNATVAIEDAQGKVVRHLASGVLGPNAPSAFKWNTNQQEVLWDGKNDKGEYVEAIDALTVRVSLGLKAHFEKTLYQAQSGGDGTTLFMAAPEGVYRVDAGQGFGDYISLLGHDGNYIRTVYPFPAEVVKKPEGLSLHEFAHDGKRLPLKMGEILRTTMLPYAWQAEKSEFYMTRRPEALAIHRDQVALTGMNLCRFTTAGRTSEFPLAGPRVTFKGQEGGVTYPTSAAFSPDGRWLYLAGCMQARGGKPREWSHGVARLEFGSDRPPEIFAGQMETPGTGNDRFNMPTSVAVDNQGRVYVSDWLNDRIQVFQPDGKWIKTLPVEKPSKISLHHKTQEIYVFSWMMRGQPVFEATRKGDVVAKPEMTHLGPLDNPTVKAAYALPLKAHPKKYDANWDTCSTQGGVPFTVGGPPNVWNATLDSWSEPPTVWLDPGSASSYAAWPCTFEEALPKMLEPREGKLVVRRDFGKETKRLLGLPFEEPTLRLGANVPLAFNPKTGLLYAGYWHTAADKYDTIFSFRQALAIDPESGKTSPVDLPFATSDMCFDLNGYAYLRRPTLVARFDPVSWREVPWDYGEETVPGEDGCAIALMGGLRVPGNGYKPQGGLHVSQDGRIAVPCYRCGMMEDIRGFEVERREEQVREKGKAYQPRSYLGRAAGKLATTLHVFDKHGKVLEEDAVKGLATLKGVGLDREGNIYLMNSAARMLNGKPYFRSGTGTLMKFGPHGGKIYCESNAILPLEEGARLSRAPDLHTISSFFGNMWVEGAEWFYGGGGVFGITCLEPGCVCVESGYALDRFARSFVPDQDHCSVAVLDTNGNVMVHLGQYGNVDDGVPLAADESKSGKEPIGSDELAFFCPQTLAVDADRRLFVADTGNRRIVSVKLTYKNEARIPLSTVPDGQ